MTANLSDFIIIAREKEAFFIVIQYMKNLFSKSLSKQKTAVLIASFIVFLAAFSFVSHEATKKTVTLVKDGEETIVKTNADTIEEFLEEQKLSPHSKDYVFPATNEKIKNDSKVVWKTAKQVEILGSSERKSVWTTASTVEELLKDEGIPLTEHDKVKPKIDTKIENDLSIQIEKAFTTVLVDGGKEKEVWTTSTTVADFLEHQGVSLKKQDRVEPQQDKMVTKDTVVKVIRVEKVTDVVEEPVEYAVVTKNDSSLSKGEEKVVTKGRAGLVKREYEVTLENGEEVSRTLLKETPVKESQDKIVAVGTKLSSKPVSRGASSNAGKEFYVTSTAYTANCNGCSGITATGFNLHENPNAKVIAVDPNVIPLGSKVYVEGYGYAIAADTGGAIKGNKIDVFFSTKEQAYRWGVRTVKIKVIE